MFERVGRPLDPEWPVRQAVAVWLFFVVLQCAGSVWAALTVIVWLVRALWSLVQWLLALWFAITVPDLELLFPELAPAEPLDIVEVDLDGGWEELDEDWDRHAGLEALPDRPLPSLTPEAPVAVDELDELDELVDVPSSAVLLKLIGSTAESGAVSDLFAGEAVLELDEALVEDIAMIGVLGALSSGDEVSGLFGSGGLGTDLDTIAISGLLGSADAGVGAGLGARGVGEGGGGLGGLGSGGLRVGGGAGKIEAGGGGQIGGLGLVGGIEGGVPGDAPDGPRLVRRAEVAWPGEPQRCVVRVRVDVDGEPTVDRFLSCPASVRDAVSHAVAASRFRPAERDGEPVVGTLSVTWR